MTDDWNDARAVYDEATGMVLIDGKPMPLSLTANEALRFADQIAKAAKLAMSQRPHEDSKEPIEWV